MREGRPRAAGTPKPADQKVVCAIVDAMDPVTLWRWKKAIDKRLEKLGSLEEASNTRSERPQKTLKP